MNTPNKAHFAINSFKLLNENGGPNHLVEIAGWYALEQEFREDGTALLAVDFNPRDAGGALRYRVTRGSNPADGGAGCVGGNRYG